MHLRLQLSNLAQTLHLVLQIQPLSTHISTFIVLRYIFIDFLISPLYDTLETNPNSNREVLTMNQKKLSLWLKAVIIAVGICGLIVYFGILPNIGSDLIDSCPELSSWHWP